MVLRTCLSHHVLTKSSRSFSISCQLLRLATAPPTSTSTYSNSTSYPSKQQKRAPLTTRHSQFKSSQSSPPPTTPTPQQLQQKLIKHLNNVWKQPDSYASSRHGSTFVRTLSEDLGVALPRLTQLVHNFTRQAISSLSAPSFSATWDIPALTSSYTSKGEQALQNHVFSLFIQWSSTLPLPAPDSPTDPPDPALEKLHHLALLTDLRYPGEYYPLARQHRRKLILHVGPTNSGKTHSALVALARARTGVYAGPLRLLAHEVFYRLNEGLVGEEGKRTCNLVTGEEQKILDPYAGLSSCTVEMFPLGRRLEVGVIDEIQMIGDIQRGSAWTNAVVGSQCETLHLCGEESVIDLIQSIADDLGDDLDIQRYTRLSPLSIAPESLQSDLSKIERGDCLVTFTRNNIFAFKRVVEEKTGLKVAVAYGGLPPEVREEQARAFNEGSYDVLVASDAVGMGLNLKIKRIVFETLHKWDGRSEITLPIPQIKQIAGRAGRYGVHTSASPTAPDDLPSPTTPSTLGLVTTLDEADMPLLRSAMAAPVVQVSRAVISPPREAFKGVYHLLPSTTPLSKINDIVLALSRTSKHFITTPQVAPANISDALQIVDPLSFSERTVLASSPVNARDPKAVATLVGFAQDFAGGQRVMIDDWSERAGLSKALDRVEEAREDEGLLSAEANSNLANDDAPRRTNPIYTPGILQNLESFHRGLTLYLWLSYRLPVGFVDFERAREKRKEVEKAIEFTLRGLRFERKDRKTRAMGKDAEDQKEVRKKVVKARLTEDPGREGLCETPGKPVRFAVATHPTYNLATPPSGRSSDAPDVCSVMSYDTVDQQFAAWAGVASSHSTPIPAAWQEPSSPSGRPESPPSSSRQRSRSSSPFMRRANPREDGESAVDSAGVQSAGRTGTGIHIGGRGGMGRPASQTRSAWGSSTPTGLHFGGARRESGGRYPVIGAPAPATQAGAAGSRSGPTFPASTATQRLSKPTSDGVARPRSPSIDRVPFPPSPHLKPNLKLGATRPSSHSNKLHLGIQISPASQPTYLSPSSKKLLLLSPGSEDLANSEVVRATRRSISSASRVNRNSSTPRPADISSFLGSKAPPPNRGRLVKAMSTQEASPRTNVSSHGARASYPAPIRPPTIPPPFKRSYTADGLRSMAISSPINTPNLRHRYHSEPPSQATGGLAARTSHLSDLPGYEWRLPLLEKLEVILGTPISMYESEEILGISRGTERRKLKRAVTRKSSIGAMVPPVSAARSRADSKASTSSSKSSFFGSFKRAFTISENFEVAPSTPVSPVAEEAPPLDIVFGVPLAVLAQYGFVTSMIAGQRHELPGVCFSTVEEIYRRGQGDRVAGVLFAPGDGVRVNELVAVFNKAPEYGEQVDFPRESISDVTSLFKRFLQDLPEPIFDAKLWRLFILACVDSKNPMHRRIACAQILLRLLPTANFSLLVYLIAFFSQVPLFPDNALPLESMAALFGAPIMSPRTLSSAAKFQRHVAGNMTAEQKDLMGVTVKKAQDGLLWLLVNWNGVADGLLEPVFDLDLDEIMGYKTNKEDEHEEELYSRSPSPTPSDPSHYAPSPSPLPSIETPSLSPSTAFAPIWSFNKVAASPTPPSPPCGTLPALTPPSPVIPLHSFLLPTNNLLPRSLLLDDTKPLSTPTSRRSKEDHTSADVTPRSVSPLPFVPKQVSPAIRPQFSPEEIRQRAVPAVDIVNEPKQRDSGGSGSSNSRAGSTQRGSASTTASSASEGPARLKLDPFPDLMGKNTSGVRSSYSNGFARPRPEDEYGTVGPVSTLLDELLAGENSGDEGTFYDASSNAPAPRLSSDTGRTRSSLEESHHIQEMQRREIQSLWKTITETETARASERSELDSLRLEIAAFRSKSGSVGVGEPGGDAAKIVRLERKCAEQEKGSKVEEERLRFSMEVTENESRVARQELQKLSGQLAAIRNVLRS
ncbi:ATP-dependent RNA helicase SUPV3L1/SUV3, partial [Phenoliferia sp. Uapishka_3]